MNTVVRHQLYLHALRQQDYMTINSVKKFILKYNQRLIKATLLIEFCKVRRIQQISKIIDPNKELPVDILKIIICDY